MSDLYKKVKSAVTAKEVADKYGIQFGKNGLAYCPFHKDTSASMIVDERYYCFGCGATGDAIDLAAKVLNMKVNDAALKLLNDFSVQNESVPSDVSIKPKKLNQFAFKVPVQFFGSGSRGRDSPCRGAGWKALHSYAQK